MSRRHLLIGVSALVAARAAHADETPALLVGARAGSGTDALARSFAPFLARHMQYTGFDVRNIQGSAGIAAARAVAEA
ncbi:MAG: tripartite tricarboxylate transporter substrate binding protein, partial [Acetobacteraceae bacterium]